MREIYKDFLCRYNECVRKPAEISGKECPCIDCVDCVDSLLDAIREAEEVLKENPYYIDGNGQLQKIEI